MKTPAKDFRSHVWIKHPDGKIISLHQKTELTCEEFDKLVALSPPFSFILIIKPQTPIANGSTNT